MPKTQFKADSQAESLDRSRSKGLARFHSESLPHFQSAVFVIVQGSLS